MSKLNLTDKLKFTGAVVGGTFVMLTTMLGVEPQIFSNPTVPLNNVSFREYSKCAKNPVEYVLAAIAYPGAQLGRYIHNSQIPAQNR